MMGKYAFFAMAFCTLLLFAACDKNGVFEDNVEMPNRSWSHASPVLLHPEVGNVEQKHNIYVNLRHTNDYPYENLWVKINTVFPSGKHISSDVNLPLADKAGNWHGSGLGEVINAQIPIQSNAILPDTGKYTFEIIQNMRIDPLPEILSVGLRLETVEE